MANEDTFYDEEKLLTEIEKDNGNLLKIKLVVLNDEKMVDIREYYFNNHQNEYRPSKKGVLLQSSELDNIDWIFEEISKYLKS